MHLAINEALNGMRKNYGGPFGAVVVRKGKIISSAHNTVLKDNDPTAHAEINAIRKASQKLGRFNLRDCILYSICEPCPMCFAAIEWAGIKLVYYVNTRKDARKIGFNDNEIYLDIKCSPKNCKKLKEIKISAEGARELFLEWGAKKDKINY